MGKRLEPKAPSPKPSRRTLAIVALGLFASTLATGCVTAYIAIGVTAVAVGAAALAFECDEPVSVSVWDPGTAHVICDAIVTATSDKGHTVELSPCYTTTLGNGTWTVTAVRPGFASATGTITVLPDHRCNEPVYHTLELTLSGSGPMPPPPPLPPSFVPPPAAPGAPGTTASPQSEAAPATAVPAPQAGAPSPAPAPTTNGAPSSTGTVVPKASFPTAPPASSAH